MQMRWYKYPISGSFPYAAKRVRTRFTSDSAVTHRTSRHAIPPRLPISFSFSPSPTECKWDQCARGEDGRTSRRTPSKRLQSYASLFQACTELGISPDLHLVSDDLEGVITLRYMVDLGSHVKYVESKLLEDALSVLLRTSFTFTGTRPNRCAVCVRRSGTGTASSRQLGTPKGD